MSSADLPASGERCWTACAWPSRTSRRGGSPCARHEHRAPGDGHLPASLRMRGSAITRFRRWYFALKLGDFHGSYDEAIGTGIRSGLGTTWCGSRA
ncbi:hypothetical protein QJS66_13375 [Kocuria rhizophila]|nr:hypothetical protein QJS66_13375 [Kocuria rhizophila]